LTGSLGNSWKASSDPIGYVRSDGGNAVIYRSSDGHIRELHLPLGGGTWSAFDLHAAASATSPAAAVGTPRPYTRTDGVTSIVYRTSGGDLWEMALTPGASWQAFPLVQGGVTSDPVGYVRADGFNAIVYRNDSGQIVEAALVGGSWLFSNLHSVVSNVPTVSSSSSGWPNAYVRADRVSSIVFKASGNGHIWELSLGIAGNWSATNLTQQAGGSL
jgi:hypothetical protein